MITVIHIVNTFYNVRKNIYCSFKLFSIYGEKNMQSMQYLNSIYIQYWWEVYCRLYGIHVCLSICVIFLGNFKKPTVFNVFLLYNVLATLLLFFLFSFSGVVFNHLIWINLPFCFCVDFSNLIWIILPSCSYIIIIVWVQQKVMK